MVMIYEPYVYAKCGKKRSIEIWMQKNPCLSTYSYIYVCVQPMCTSAFTNINSRGASSSFGFTGYCFYYNEVYPNKTCSEMTPTITQLLKLLTFL
ncbi:NADH dehydrogenase subunit 5 [Iris pallida]|uniref:NADH dehydrogenase subunit 5 (Chloroplast) n=1 Tax=Iris pallida TaxID=29817 RepID=A0AAX6EKE5_IRIPA|nr:NADH dehydrogenase subunit 5 [Iris pallida]